jgi:hypothetical protein
VSGVPCDASRPWRTVRCIEDDIMLKEYKRLDTFMFMAGYLT